MEAPINEKFFDLIDSYKKPFTKEELYKTANIKSNNFKKDLDSFFEMTDQFVIDNDIIYPKITFLKKINLNIIPTEFEINNNILILGHRIIPLQASGFNIDDVELFFNIKKINKIEKKIESEEIDIYFSLLSMHNMPIKNFHDFYFKNAKKAEIYIFDMKEFYNKNNFKQGDGIIIKYKDYYKCEFNIEYYSKDKHQENFFYENKINDEFIISLKKVLELKLPYPNIEKQLLYSFYFIKDQDFSVPVTSLGPLLNENRDILIGMYNNGIKVLFLKGQNINDFQSYPDLEEIEEELDDLELDTDSIDGILKYFGNTNSETIIRALIYNQLAFEKYDYQEIMEYLFKGLPKPYLPEDIENIFKKHIKKVHNEILNSFDKNPPLLPISLSRKKILEILLKITLFLRELDNKNTQLENIPKEDFYNLSEICSNLEDMLYFMEDPYKDKNDYQEIEQFNETINLFEKNLPALFNEIKNKINI